MKSSSTFYRQVGERIKAARKRRPRRVILQRELAARINVSQSALSYMESGRMRPNAYRLWRIAKVLGVPVASLFP